jgi:branched-chain amino acid transport system permease protein
MTPSRRHAALTLGALVLAGVIGQLLLPRHAPSGVLFKAALFGCANALLAAGLVLVYRSARIVNFAQGAIGAVAAYLTFVLVQLVGLPFFAVLPLTIAAAALSGLLVDGLFVQRFFNAPRLVLTVVTIVVAQLIGNPRVYVHGLPGISAAVRTVKGRAVVDKGLMDLPFPGFHFTLFPTRFGFAAVLTIGLTVVTLGGLALFLRTSRVGTAIRGTAANAERAVSLGINVRLLSSTVWAIAGVLSGLAALLHGMNRGAGFADLALFSPELLIPALAGAVLARMRSLPVAVGSAFGITVVQQMIDWSYRSSPAVDIIVLVAVVGALLVSRDRAGRSEEGQTQSWEATKEIRPIPRELARVPGVRRTRRGLIAFAVVAVVVFPFASSDAQTNLGSVVFIRALVALSLVVLTGWGGQVSLGQFGFVAVAGLVGGHLTAETGLNFWLALPVVAGLGAGLAVLVGLPALRIRGSYLAVTSFLFAVAVYAVLGAGGAVQRFIPERVYRPTFLFVSFASERNYYFLCLGFVVAAAWVVSRLRAGRPGRVLIALRENEPGVQSFGIAAVRTRLAAFALSGALASIAGILFVHHQRALDRTAFSVGMSVDMFVMAMIGGISSVPGALLGAAYLGVTSLVIPSAVLRNVATSGGLLLLLVFAPGGLAGIAASVRDSALRIVATRRGIAAPSLFADGDNEAMVAQMAPLVEPLPYRGLEAIPADRRYTRQSEFHGQPVSVSVPVSVEVAS